MYINVLLKSQKFNLKNNIMSDSFKVLFGMIIGAAAGVVTGILIAPAPGKETRGKVHDKTIELLEGIDGVVFKKKKEKKKKEKKKAKKKTSKKKKSKKK